MAIQATDDPVRPNPPFKTPQVRIVIDSPSQIAVNEAIPYREFETNPYTVCLTTSLGGHLAFFEMGGGRWHSKPVSNFLNHMATKVDLDHISHKVDGDTVRKPQYGADFDPMRRRMYIAAVE